MNVVCSAVSLALPTLAFSGANRRISDHIDSCIRCRAEVDSYAEMQRTLGSLVDETSQAPGGLPQRVMSSIGPVAVPDRGTHREHYVPVAAAAALATAACSGVVLLRIYRQRAA